jgi:hypothetical protein
MHMTTPQRILFAPLDWGLGHATRCIPLIRRELECGNQVVLAGSGRSAALLRKAFPNLTLHEIPDYDVQYQKKGSFVLRLIMQLPKIFRAVRDEHQWLEEFLEKEHVDLIVSDNRYGMYSRKVKSVIITHQVFPIAPGILSGLTQLMVNRHLNRFDELWIPDFGGADNLAGRLCHGKIPPHAKYIGPLSRFIPPAVTSPGDAPDVIVLVSGPEPQRTIFLEHAIAILSEGRHNAWIVSGTPEQEGTQQLGTLTIYPHLGDEALTRAITLAKQIVCRSGYTTLMDLHALGRNAVLIPTPGQTEQEYLAAHFHDTFGWPVIRQERIVTELPALLNAIPSRNS